MYLMTTSVKLNYLQIQLSAIAVGECLRQPEALADSCICRLAKLLNLSRC